MYIKLYKYKNIWKDYVSLIIGEKIDFFFFCFHLHNMYLVFYHF